jgi:CheY-like chemotaxis protein
MRVLIAEDNPENLDMLRRRLERRGHAVFAAPDGQVAVAMTNELKPDIVLMDVSMPVLSGLEATRAIRAQGDGVAKTPIVALTAHAMDGDRQRCMDAGCDAYATKPVDLPSLIETMERLVPAA